HQFLLQPALVRLGTDAPVINIAGRQRMLSQKLAKGALELLVSADANRRQIETEFRETLTLWETSHRLLDSDRATADPWTGNSAEIQRLFAQLRLHFEPMRAAATRLDQLLMSQPQNLSSAAIRSEVDQVVRKASPFLTEMDAIVTQYTR